MDLFHWLFVMSRLAFLLLAIEAAELVRTIAAFMISSISSQFKFNLLLQIFDGLFTYHVLSLGVPEANPFVRNAIFSWGDVWGLVYWKLLACALLGLIFTLRHYRQGLTLKALTLTSTIYSCLFVISIYHFLWVLCV